MSRPRRKRYCRPACRDFLPIDSASVADFLKSILIIKPSSLGDIVHTLPAVAAIREANPTRESLGD